MNLPQGIIVSAVSDHGRWLAASRAELIQRFNEACNEITRSSMLSDEVEGRLSSLFRNRFRLAREAIEKGKVKKYVFQPSGRTAWIVLGHVGEYEVLPLAPFCGCDDFYFNVLQGKAFLCYHLIAQRLAEALNRFEKVQVTDTEREVFMEGWRLPRQEKVRPAYLEVIDDIRDVAFQVLVETGGLTTKELYSRLTAWGYEIPSVRNLAMALWADPERRFKHTGELWLVAERV